MLTRRDDPEALEAYATDESGIFRAAGVEAILYAETAADVSAALAEANASGTLVTVSGGGTGITGGRVATHGGVVLSTETLRAPEPPGPGLRETASYGRRFAIELDESARLARVPVGVSLSLLDSLLPEGLFFPPDPTEKTAFVGGALATNASGARTFHFGAVRRWVQGLTVILPTGEPVALERGEIVAREGFLDLPAGPGGLIRVPIPTYTMPAVKNAAGLYAAPDMDAVDLFVGSEGLLGVITEARLKLAPTPPEIVSQMAFFAEESQALDFVDDMRAASAAGAITVLALEYFDSRALAFVQHPLVEGRALCAVFVELAAGMDELDPLLEALETHGSVEDWFAESADERREHRDFRHSVPESVNDYVRRQGSQKLGTDLVVPGAHFRAMVAAYHAAGEAFAERFPRPGEHALMFGHIGDYHLHVNFITHNAEELAFAKALYADLARTAVGFGGTLSGEHGVGKKTALVEGRQVPYLELMYGREGLLQIARTKRALDPNLILNLGNMVPREYYSET